MRRGVTILAGVIDHSHQEEHGLQLHSGARGTLKKFRCSTWVSLDHFWMINGQRMKLQPEKSSGRAEMLAEDEGNLAQMFEE